MADKQHFQEGQVSGKQRQTVGGRTRPSRNVDLGRAIRRELGDVSALSRRVQKENDKYRSPELIKSLKESDARAKAARWKGDAPHRRVLADRASRKQLGQKVN